MNENWKQMLKQSITKPEEISLKFKIDVDSLKAVVSKHPMKISKYYFSLIEEVDDPIWKQCIPSHLEIETIMATKIH